MNENTGLREGGAAASSGSSLFLEPMAWMAGAVVGTVQGKLYCPACNARLGSFNWSGAPRLAMHQAR
jgi:dual specificity phosphatase 12